jgi:hypothetical protein
VGNITLGVFQACPVTDAFGTEVGHFTPWLATPTGLRLLSEAVDLPLALVQTVAPVGDFRADLLCRGGQPVTNVVVENQFGLADSLHLGKLLAYAAGHDARLAIWVAEAFRPEHLAVLDQLNALAPERLRLMAVQLSVWRIGDSMPAVRLECVHGLQPRSNLIKAVNVAKRSTPVASAMGPSPPLRAARVAFWAALEVARLEAGLRFASPPKGSATDDKTWWGWATAWPNVQLVVYPWPDSLRVGLVAPKDATDGPWTQSGVASRLTSINAALEGAVALTDRRSLTPRVPHFATERCWTLEHLDRAGHADAAAWTVALLASLDDALRHAGVGGRQQAP